MCVSVVFYTHIYSCISIYLWEGFVALSSQFFLMFLNAGSGDFRTKNLSLGIYIFSSFPRVRTN